MLKAEALFSSASMYMNFNALQQTNTDIDVNGSSHEEETM